MHAALIMMVATATAADPAAEPTIPASVRATAKALAPQLQTGTLLFSDGKSLTVKIVSWSQFTHVATVVRHAGHVSVYESQPEVGVHRISLAEYLASVAGEQIEILEPSTALGEKRAGRYRKYLINQLGRPYAIMHFVTGTRSEGLHCAEYVTDALVRIHLIQVESPSHVSPASLRDGLLTYDLYEVTNILTMPTPAGEGGWGTALWEDTKGCWSACWSGVRSCAPWDS